MMRNASLGLLLFLLAVPPQFAHPTGGFSEGALVSVLDRAVQASMARRPGTAAVLSVESGRLLAVHRREVASRRLAAPGSTLKPFTLLALLEARKLNPEEPFVCPTRLTLGGYRMDCTHVVTSRPFNAVTALAYSCNNYFAHFAPRLANSDLRQAFNRSGFSSRTGLANREAAGSLRPAASLEEHKLQALGQSGIRITPLELLAAYRKLALRRKEHAEESRIYQVIFAGLEAAAEYGTARLAQPEGLRVAGKTGTASARNGPWTHAWFAGYAPADDPEVVVVVFLERGTGGSDAAPIAGEIFAAYQAARQSR